MKPQDSYSLNTLTTSLAAAIAAPALFITPYAAAQSADAGVTQLSPVRVEGEGSSYQTSTAQSPKMTAPLLDTPRTVQVVPRQVIQDQAASSLQDVLRNSPGITFGAGEGGRPGGDLPIIRGQNSAGSIFLDGIRDSSTQVRDTFNLEQVEIIKGPDSVYAGRGGAGGSINMVSKTPKAVDFTEGTAQIGTDNNYRATIDSNWRLADKAAFRLNVMGNKGDVPGRDNAVDFERWGVAPSLMLGVGTPTRITLSYYHYQDDSMPDYSIPYDPATGQPVTETKGVSRKSFYGLTGRDFMKTRDDVATVDFQHDFSDKLQLRNVTRYGRGTTDFAATNPDDSKGNVPNGFVYRALKSGYYVTKSFANQTDLTGEFETGSLKHSFDLGFEYSNIKQDKDGYTQSGVPTSTNCTRLSVVCASLWDPDPHTDYTGSLRRNENPARYNTDTVALYAFDTIKLNEQWQASLGGRWDNYRTSASNLTSVPATATAKREDNLFNYQVGLAYKPLPNGTIYATYGTSSTPSAVAGSAVSDAVTVTNQTLEPEKSRTVELGTKWEVLDNKLTLSAAAFHDVRKNTSVAISANETAQVGEAKVRGIELGFSGAITPKWNVFGGYTFMDSEMTKGAYNSGAVGQDLPNTPRNAFSLWTTYKVLPKLTVGGGAYYVDKVYGNSDATKNANGTPKARWVPSYWRFDAMAAYEFNEHISAQLNVLNIFDETYYTKAYAAHYAALGTGRAALLSLRMRY
ncbi:TonB-dependent receptor [Achromobacter arsenitoxydans]|uniref:TonB-dependent siderophore receptor family protein 5 n=1 Tax=Achromobacter arsenitoxydans SY8 TaxID=477184 RepID=H0F4Y0_9BURK|nr:TonB-dependent siderophore receptor [Achromobacter arsenitoxydans]EHK66687.1 TonB-dependent siderophore receptor family protein 5 [Achromobacter arsenitoxydans SY8]